MHDPALRIKAEEMFVLNGFSMESILTMLGDDVDVSRKTLYNWRQKDNWEEKRLVRVKRTTGRRERLEQALDEAINEYMVTKDPKLLFGIGKATAALKSMNTFQFTEEKKGTEDEIKKGYSPENLEKLEKELMDL